MVIVIYFIVPTTLDVRVVLGCACLYIRNSYTCEKCVIPIIARTEKLQCVSPSTGLYVFSQCYWSILGDRSNLYFAVNIITVTDKLLLVFTCYPLLGFVLVVRNIIFPNNMTCMSSLKRETLKQ